MVHSYAKEEDVQVSIWPICVDTHDSNCGVHTIVLHRRQHFRGDFLVTYVSNHGFGINHTQNMQTISIVGL